MADLTSQPTVPAPRTTLRIRTLATDLEAMRASGGMTLSPSGVTTHIDAHPVQSVHTHVVSTILGWLAVFLAIAGLSVGAYLGYLRLTTPPEITTPLTEQPTPTLPPADSLASRPKTVAAHTSLLPQRAPHVQQFSLEAPPQTLKTHLQLVREALATLPSSVRVAEIIPTTRDGAPLSFPGYATLAGAADLLPGSRYAEFFEDDMTMLVIRDGERFSAAYILALKPSMTRVYAEPYVRLIEQSTTLLGLQPGIPSIPADIFTTETLTEDVTVRSLRYTSPPGVLSYGWFANRLVIATDRSALDSARSLLCLETEGC